MVATQSQDLVADLFELKAATIVANIHAARSRLAQRIPGLEAEESVAEPFVELEVSSVELAHVATPYEQ